MDKEIKFWGPGDEEYLTHTTMDDAIESILDGIGDINDLTETIEVCGFARRKPDLRHEAAYILERFIEYLDDEYADPDGDCTDATDGMREAAVKFVEDVLDDYTSWACEIVHRETVNTHKWIRENRPDWIEEKNNE